MQFTPEEIVVSELDLSDEEEEVVAEKKYTSGKFESDDLKSFLAGAAKHLEHKKDKGKAFSDKEQDDLDFLKTVRLTASAYTK